MMVNNNGPIKLIVRILLLSCNLKNLLRFC